MFVLHTVRQASSGHSFVLKTNVYEEKLYKCLTCTIDCCNFETVRQTYSGHPARANYHTLKVTDIECCTLHICTASLRQENVFKVYIGIIAKRQQHRIEFRPHYPCLWTELE